MTDNRTTELLRKMRKMLDGCRRTETVGFDTYWITADALDNSLDELEQAVAATLGSGTLTAEQVREAIEKRFDFDVWVPKERWQAIADELNAELGSGTCEPKWTLQGETQTQEFWRCECGNCGHEFGVETRESFPLKMTIGKVGIPNYCPNCGKKVKR